MKKTMPILLILISLLLSNCQSDKKKEEPTADAVISKAIAVAGTDRLANATLSFDFRDKSYKATRNSGVFRLERLQKDTIGDVRDVLSNSGFERYVNDELLILSDSISSVYSNSVNSVHYFAVLPFGLEDQAVQRTYKGEEMIKNNAYHKIEVTFAQDGGGKDHDDIFLYWVNTKSHKIDYMAYSYKEQDGSLGLRFREVFNEQIKNGVRFVDYNNFKPKAEPTGGLMDLAQMFENDDLELLSKIELKKIEVSHLE